MSMTVKDEGTGDVVRANDGMSTTMQSAPTFSIVLAYLFCALIWGTTWYAIRVCIGPACYPTYPAAAMRFTLASFILAIIWLIQRTQIRKTTTTEIKWISVAGLLSGLAYCTLYTAEEHITGGLAAVISATQPLIASIIAHFTGTEKLRRTIVIGSILSVLGVSLVFHDRMQVSKEQAFAVGIMIISCSCISASNVTLKRQVSQTSPIASNTIYFLAASTLLWIVSAACGQCSIPTSPPLAATMALLYLSLFGTLFAFASFFYLLKHVRLSTTMTLAFVTPIIALAIDAFFEKHSALTIESYLGIGIVLSGVAVSIINRNKPLAPDKAASIT